MKRRWIMAAVCAALLSAGSVAAGGTDFSGTWALNKEKSEGLQGPMASADQTLTVTQNEKELATETRITVEGQERPSQKFTYNLDGSETTAEITGRMAGTAKLTAKWMGGGKILELKQVREINFQGNEVTITITEHWESADGGKALKIHRVIDSPRGQQETKLSFDKK